MSGRCRRVHSSKFASKVGLYHRGHHDRPSLISLPRNRRDDDRAPLLERMQKGPAPASANGQSDYCSSSVAALPLARSRFAMDRQS
jgi:hypothetical protein